MLVVDDDANLRRRMGDALRHQGYRVTDAANGADAMALLDRIRPDAIVLDLLMPVMHGWDFMEHYAEKTNGKPVPIVVVSVNPALPRSFDRFGVCEVLPKPFDVEVLVRSVAKATRTRRA